MNRVCSYPGDPGRMGIPERFRFFFLKDELRGGVFVGAVVGCSCELRVRS